MRLGVDGGYGSEVQQMKSEADIMLKVREIESRLNDSKTQVEDLFALGCARALLMWVLK